MSYRRLHHSHSIRLDCVRNVLHAKRIDTLDRVDGVVGVVSFHALDEHALIEVVTIANNEGTQFAHDYEKVEALWKDISYVATDHSTTTYRSIK